jgi:hypothetical protein
MHTYRPPTPRVLGKGYGSHLVQHFRLAKKFGKLMFISLVHAFVPCTYIDRVHYQVINLYYRFKGLRHGTMNPKRCDHCGITLEPRDEQPAVPIETSIETPSAQQPLKNYSGTE